MTLSRPGPEPEERPPASAPPAKRGPWLRLGLLVLVLAVTLGVGKALGADAYLTKDHIQELMAAAGLWAIPVYWAVFSLGEFVQVPGWVFIAAATAGYEWLPAFFLALSGATVSALVSFLVVRGISGHALAELKNRWLQRILALVDRRPILTVFVLRLILWAAPPLNYALGLTRIRLRDYLIGTVLGLAPPVLGLVVLFDWLFEQDVAALAREHWPWAAALLALAGAAFAWWRWRQRRAEA